MTSNSQNKKWNDVHLAITAISVTAMLGMWNLFATPNKPQAATQVSDTATSLPPAPTETQAPAPTAQPIPTTTLAFRPVKIIYGGVVPTPQIQPTNIPAQQVVQVVPAAPAKKKKSGGGGGGGSEIGRASCRERVSSPV